MLYSTTVQLNVDRDKHKIDYNTFTWVAPWYPAVMIVGEYLLYGLNGTRNVGSIQPHLKWDFGFEINFGSR